MWIRFDRRVRRAARKGPLDGDERRLKRGILVFPRRDGCIRRGRDFRLLRRVPLAEASSLEKPVVETPEVGTFRRRPGRRAAVGRWKRTGILVTLAEGNRGLRRRRVRVSLCPLVNVFPLVLVIAIVIVGGDRLRLRGGSVGIVAGEGSAEPRVFASSSSANRGSTPPSAASPASKVICSERLSFPSLPAR